MHVPFQYSHSLRDDQQDATLDMMLIKNIHETGWFNANPALNAPFAQHWAEWPMGGDLLAYTVKKVIVDTTGNVPLTLNLFWLLTFPLTALAAFPVLRSLRCSWAAAVVGSVLFSLAPYHFFNGAGHENLAFYVGVPAVVLMCVKILGPDHALPTISELRNREGWRRLRWLLLGAVLIGVTGIYYLAFLVTLLAICAVVTALARRRPGRFLMAALFGVAGLAASFLANLPTLLYRWQHTANLLDVPARQPGSSESYPLRIVELLSPVPVHRFAPFAALANRLYEPGREGLTTSNLGLAAGIGFACAVIALLASAVRGAERRGSSLEVRLGFIIVAAVLLASKGGLSRALELVGLNGVRAWNRIAIIVAFASIVVFARLLDRFRAFVRRRRWPRPRLIWTTALAIILLVGVLDQASPAKMPDPKANAQMWQSDTTFVASMERRLPRNAMVFQLPVVDFPERSAIEQMPAYDQIKVGYLHSNALRWSAGGIRGRDGEWQWPASFLPMRDLVRGLIAIGFSALTLNRDGFPNNGTVQLHQLHALLGEPIAADGNRVIAWDLRPATASLLGNMSAGARAVLARRMLDAPRIYLSSDADPLTSRGGPQAICARGSLRLVNPGTRSVREELELTLHERQSTAQRGRVTIGTRTALISAGRANFISVNIPPGTTRIDVSVDTPGVRCGSTPTSAFPSVSASLRARHAEVPT